MTNLLLITLDQFRGDAMSCAGHPVVHTPALDRLARHGVRFARHYATCAPCAPGRASLYTGMYQMNHRVVANGTPLDHRFDNLALAARRAGFAPALFGYTDQSVDPRTVTDPDDPRLEHYEGILPGFDPVLPLVRSLEPWRRWLADQGHDEVPDTALGALAGEPQRPAEHSLAAFMTGEAINWIDEQTQPFFAHLSYLRPHPPYAAAGHFADAVPASRAGSPIEPIPAERRHRLHQAMIDHPVAGAPRDPERMAALRAQYFGMVAEVDHQLGRLFDALEHHGIWDDTIIIVVADHGEQLGDHGIIEKGGFFEQSYHIPGILRDPRHPETHGQVIDRFTENIDIFPTICELLDLDVPLQCDGLPLTAFLAGEDPPWWREAAHWEYDWRSVFLEAAPDPDAHPWPWDRHLETQHLAVHRDLDHAYVQFGDGTWRCFDLEADPTWRTEVTDPTTVFPLARSMLTWRSGHADRTLADTLIDRGIRGRIPPPSS